MRSPANPFAVVALAATLLARPTGAQAQRFRLPTPTGPSPLGTSTFNVNRPPAAPGDEEAPGTLVVTAWYPAASASGAAARAPSPYLREESALRQMAAWGSAQATATLERRDVLTHSWLDAPVARAASLLPVLLFSHGYLAMPSDYTALMEELASHGYAVFSIAHTGESMAVSLPGGRVEAIVGADNQLRPLPRGVIGDWGDEDSVAAAVTSAAAPARAEETLRRYLARIPHATATVERWVGDTRAVMDELTRLSVPQSGSVFARRISVSHVAALGHSMGGVASAVWCARDRAFVAEHLLRVPSPLLRSDRPFPEVEFRQLTRGR